MAGVASSGPRGLIVAPYRGLDGVDRECVRGRTSTRRPRHADAGRTVRV